MTHLKMLGTWVRLADGRTGHVAASGIDGLVVIVDGRMVTAKDVTPIAPPAAVAHPDPQRSAQRPIQTSHEPNPFPNRPQGLSVLVNERWSDPQ
jgi:hypothetical protein